MVARRGASGSRTGALQSTGGVGGAPCGEAGMAVMFLRPLPVAPPLGAVVSSSVHFVRLHTQQLSARALQRPKQRSMCALKEAQRCLLRGKARQEGGASKMGSISRHPRGRVLMVARRGASGSRTGALQSNGGVGGAPCGEAGMAVMFLRPLHVAPPLGAVVSSYVHLVRLHTQQLSARALQRPKQRSMCALTEAQRCLLRGKARQGEGASKMGSISPPPSGRVLMVARRGASGSRTGALQSTGGVGGAPCGEAGMAVMFLRPLHVAPPLVPWSPHMSTLSACTRNTHEQACCSSRHNGAWVL
jgi:hypothetical protein